LKRLLFIISNIDKSIGFESTALHLSKQKYRQDFILLHTKETEFERYLISSGFNVWRVFYSSKKDLISAIVSVFKIIKNRRYDIVHTHLFEASLIGLLAAKLAKIKTRIHTRHHATLHHDRFPMAVYYDRYINYLSTDIVAPSENIYNILINREKCDKAKVRIIHHGFDLDLFEKRNEQAIERLKQKYNPATKKPVIGVISRYTEWKGIQFIIPAFKQLLVTYPNALLILANARGDYSGEIKSLLSDLPDDSFREIEFEEDVASLYHLFDVFVHVPIDLYSEAFGQIYVEALAAGVPSIFSMSGIAKEFIVNQQNALVVEYKNSHEIHAALVDILKNSSVRDGLVKKGRSSVSTLFELKKMILGLEALYDK
jgi:glycosyltransferase involved in cell wall biosynthesis